MSEQKEKKYYLHRISHESNASYALLKLGYLSLGWWRCADTDIMDAARDNGYDRFNKITEEKGISKNRSRWCMWYFARMNPGDIVIVPKYDGKFGAYEVEEQAQPIQSIKDKIPSFKGKWDETLETLINWNENKSCYEKKGKEIDLGFVIKVRCIFPEFERKLVTSELTSRMKIRVTTADISDLKTIEACIKAGEDQKPILLYENIIDDLATKLTEQICTILNEDQFEELIKWYMERCNAVSWILPKNDPDKEDYADADVVGVFNNLKHMVYVQAKHHKNMSTTSDWSVEQIKRYKDQGIGKNNKPDDYDQENEDDNYQWSYSYWVITSGGDFSKDALNIAKDNSIRLINGKEFSRMLIDVGLKNLDDVITKR